MKQPCVFLIYESPLKERSKQVFLYLPPRSSEERGFSLGGQLKHLIKKISPISAVHLSDKNSSLNISQSLFTVYYVIKVLVDACYSGRR